MNYKLIIIFLFILSSCDQSIYKKSKKTNTVIFDRYKNSGFALIYSDNLKDIKKIDHRSFNIYHKTLKKKSMVNK